MEEVRGIKTLSCSILSYHIQESCGIFCHFYVSWTLHIYSNAPDFKSLNVYFLDSQETQFLISSAISLSNFLQEAMERQNSDMNRAISCGSGILPVWCSFLWSCLASVTQQLFMQLPKLHRSPAFSMWPSEKMLFLYMTGLFKCFFSQQVVGPLVDSSFILHHSLSQSKRASQRAILGNCEAQFHVSTENIIALSQLKFCCSILYTL